MNAVVQTINSAGQAFITFALPMLIQSSVLILILLAVDLVLRRRVRAVFRYWIWMLVLVKLVLPPSLWSPISFGTWFGRTLEIPAVALEEPAEPSYEDLPGPAVWQPQAQLGDGLSPAWDNIVGEYVPTGGVTAVGKDLPMEPPEPSRTVAPPAAPSLTWQGLTLLAWATVAVALLLLLAQRALFVKDLVAQAELAPDTLQKTLDECRDRVGLARPLAVKLSPSATTPAVCGLLKPVILIPRSLVPKLRPRDLQAVLLHELAHVKRGDLWVNLLQTFLQIIYFYSPLLWIANAMIRRVREKAVDEAVLVAMGESARRYPETLVNIAKLAFRRRPALSLRMIGVVESKGALRSRIKHILNHPLPKTARLSLFGTIIVCLVAAVLLPMAKAWPFTDRARNVMILAEEEARALNHPYVGTEHILLALARQEDAVSAKVLQNLGAGVAQLRAGVGKFVQPGSEPVRERALAETPRAKRVMEYAKDEARGLGHDYVGTEHILLGLLREEEGVAAQVLGDVGVTWQQVRAETLKFVKPGGTAPTDPGAGAGVADADGDGLSDLQEVHKYLTDPTKADSDSDGIPDGDWDERREYSYSVRTVLRYLPPLDEDGLNDDFQDGRVLKRTDDYIEVEVVHYPLATVYDSIGESPNWRRDYARMTEYLSPGVTANWDEQMQRDLRAALKADGIDVETLTDKQVVERVSQWLLRRSRSLDKVFTTYYAYYPDGKPQVYPGLEEAFRREFERDSDNYDWTIDEHFDHELLGDGMFYNRTHGSCTSTAVYLTTVLRALGIPTRIILVTPAVDASDREQVLMVKNAITHNRVRETMLAGLRRSSHGFTNHAFNEVYVGNRWVRLDYHTLGPPTLGVNRFGLQTRLYTLNDLSDANFAPTWGIRYAKGERSDIFKYSNPYSAVSISDSFGAHSHVPNPPFDAQSLASGSSALPDIFVLSPSAVGVWDDVIAIVKDQTYNKTGRPHRAEFYENIFGGVWATKSGDILVLVFSLDTPERIPEGYEDLLPRPWPEIESRLRQGGSVELGAEARGMNVILLAAPTSGALKPLIQGSRLLGALRGGGETPVVPIPSATGSVVRLDNGVTIELLGVCEHPSQGRQWWRPDGAALETAPYETTGSLMKHEEGYADFEFAAQVSGPGGTAIRWRIPGGNRGSDTGRALGAGGKRLDNTYAYTSNQPADAKMTDVSIGIASGPWQTRAIHETPATEGSYSLEESQAVAFGAAYEVDGRAHVPVTTNIGSKEVNYRVVAVDGRGELHVGSVSGHGGNVLNSMTCRFDLPLNDINALRFQTRPYLWVEFRNVSLRRGQSTEIQVQTQLIQNQRDGGAGGGAPVEPAVLDAAAAASDQAGPLASQRTDRYVPPDPLQRLVDKAPPGATITVPKGTYVTPIEITKPLVLRGESAQDCIVEVTADSPAIAIDTKGQGNVTVENLTIKWQRATSDRSSRPFALCIKDSNVLIRNCQFEPLGNNQRCPVAVRVDGFSEASVNDCQFRGFDYTVCYGPGSEGIVQDCILIDPGHQGVTGYENSTLRVERTIVMGSGYHGLRCTGGTLHARDNILADNRISGVYLGNKDGRGTVINNLMLRNATAVAGYYQAGFSVENNILADSTAAGVGMWSTCRLSVRRNVFRDNTAALVVYPKDGQDNNIIGRNTFWQNAAAAKGCTLSADSILADPQFADPNHGDFSAAGPVREQGQGLTDPRAIRDLWPRYEQARRQRSAGTATRWDVVPPRSQRPAAARPESTQPIVSSGPIQQKINAAAPGDTITLPAGVFEERLVIDKPLTLEGAGWEKTTIMMRVDGPALAEQMQRAIQERIGDTTNESEISAVARQVRDSHARPVVLVTGTDAVTIRGVKFSCPGRRLEGRSLPIPVLRFSGATAHLTDCAVLGSTGDGIQIADGSNVEIDNSLIAAVWSTGIVVDQPADGLSRVRIHDCDIRNCHYAGVRIRKGNDDTVIERCRISGAAWHGVRYDDVSPRILNNIIFGNARSGIYASGRTKATVAHNLFYRNEMTGLSCWFQNQDLVLNNTFADNKRSGLEILGASKPAVRMNIFYANPTGISGGYINDDSPLAKPGAPVLPRGCLFWANEHDMQWRLDPNTMDMIALDDDTDTRRIDPQFVSAATKDFSLQADSPVRRSGIGAVDPIPFASPWALQPEELAIIPEGDTRDYRQWKTP